MSIEDEEDICGETFDHDEETTYDGPDGRQWLCRRCGAEGWEDVEDDEEVRMAGECGS